MPPDAFSIPAPNPGEDPVTEITLAGETGDLTLRRNPDGLAADFPFLIDGEWHQAHAGFSPSGEVTGFTIEADPPWELTFLDPLDAMPVRVRLIRADAVYFAALDYEGPIGTETWYDRDGGALAVFTYSHAYSNGKPVSLTLTDFTAAATYTETYSYDSRGAVSGINSPAGEFSALYVRARMPRYWEQPAFRRAVLQWDERGFLIRFSGDTETTDLRYEYRVDERGNWIERREIRMIRREGFLVPEAGAVIRRNITYGGEQ
jgi:YD repeat-containing protein